MWDKPAPHLALLAVLTLARLSNLRNRVKKLQCPLTAGYTSLVDGATIHRGRLIEHKE